MKNPHTSKKSHTHLQCVHNNYVRFEEYQPRGVRGIDYTKYNVGAVYSKHAEKWLSPTTCRTVNVSKNIRTLPKCHMHIFNVSITTARFEKCQPKIRVRIDPPHPLMCRKRRLNGAILRMRQKNRGPVSQQVWHDKDPWGLPAQRP
jgi:hypothetical protein